MAIEYVENNEYSTISRYQILREILEGKDRYLETYNQVIIPDSDEDVYHVVSQGEENRLDIIAQNYYGESSYWWAIALANELLDPFIVEVGTMVRIPPRTSLVDSKNEILYRRS